MTGQRYFSLVLFMDYCSWITVSRITIGHNAKIVLQHNLPTSVLPCNTIFQLPFLAIHSCILQYNFHVVCFPTILQYNVAIQFPPSLAIQSLATTQPRLQYKFVLQLNLHYSCNIIQATQAFFSTIQKLYCNTIFTTNFFSSLLSCNTIARLEYKFYFIFTRQLGSSPKTVFALFFFCY